jgi:hypothetical protein
MGGIDLGAMAVKRSAREKVLLAATMIKADLGQ